jgi:hypothetical protein
MGTDASSRYRNDHPNQVGVHTLQSITRQPAERKAIRRYPIRKVTTPVPVEGGVAGGALAHERRQLVPWAQEAERIGVPPPHHGGGPGRGEACDKRDVAV